MTEPRKPKRRHVLDITVDADSLEDLQHSLEEFARKIAFGEMGPNGVSGGGSYSWMYRHEENANQTPDGYRNDLKAWLDWKHAEESKTP